MRMIFVSGTTVGGSGRSQRELAAQLEQFGHQIEFLVDDGREARLTRWVYGHFSDLAARREGRIGGRPTSWLERRPGRRLGSTTIDGRRHHIAVIPQNAIETMIERFVPDVVVGNSLERLAWRRIHGLCRQHRVRTVLYVRETDSLDHFRDGETPDLLLANARSLQSALVERGLECSFVPSVIDVDITRTESTRRVALAINPIQSRGVDIVWQVAQRLPEIPFVVQESWPLVGDELAAVERHAEALPNVEFRRAAPPGPELYGDARVLLVPYRVDNRPRVIAEAQANGIPVIAADVPALAEAIGDGGVTVPMEDIDKWCGAISELWTDEGRYRALVSAAVEHSKRPDIDANRVAAAFEGIVLDLVDQSAG